MISSFPDPSITIPISASLSTCALSSPQSLRWHCAAHAPRGSELLSAPSLAPLVHNSLPGAPSFAPSTAVLAWLLRGPARLMARHRVDLISMRCIRRCVHRKRCRRGSMSIQVSAPQSAVRVTVPSKSRSRGARGQRLLVASCLREAKDAHAALVPRHLMLPLRGRMSASMSWTRAVRELALPVRLLRWFDIFVVLKCRGLGHAHDVV